MKSNTTKFLCLISWPHITKDIPNDVISLINAYLFCNLDMDWLVWLWDITFLCPPIADIIFLKYSCSRLLQSPFTCRALIISNISSIQVHFLKYIHSYVVHMKKSKTPSLVPETNSIFNVKTLNIIHFTHQSDTYCLQCNIFPLFTFTPFAHIVSGQI